MNATPTQTDYLLSQILRQTRNAEANAAQAAAESARAASNSAPRIGWVSATLISITLVTIVLPLCQKLDVPYVGAAMETFSELTRETGEYIGIFTATNIIYRQTEQHRLNGIHPDLISVYHLANEYAHQDGIHIHIREGLRTSLRQLKLYRRGFSATLNSRHLDGHALDLSYRYKGPQSNKKDWEYARKINKYMQKAARKLGVRVEWGGHWKSFPDGFHWQLPWKAYPKISAKKKHQSKITKRNKQAALTKRNTEALLKAIIHRESSNDHRKENRITGMLGLCQVSAATLVEIGLMHRDAYNQSKARIKASSDNRKQFLRNPDNWILKGGKKRFMSSREIQLKACREVLKLHMHYGRAFGVIDGNSTQRRIAGWLFAAQFGHKRATDYYLRGIDRTDGNVPPVLTSTYAKLGEATIKE